MKLHATITQRGPLTQQEARVLGLLCTGLLRKQIAHSMHRSYGSVSKQIESIAEKLNAHSAAEIVAKAVANGLVDISLKTILMVMVCNAWSAESVNTDMRRQPKTPRPPITRHHTPRFQRDI